MRRIANFFRGFHDRFRNVRKGKRIKRRSERLRKAEETSETHAEKTFVSIKSMLGFYCSRQTQQLYPRNFETYVKAFGNPNEEGVRVWRDALLHSMKVKGRNVSMEKKLEHLSNALEKALREVKKVPERISSEAFIPEVLSNNPKEASHVRHNLLNHVQGAVLFFEVLKSEVDSELRKYK